MLGNQECFKILKTRGGFHLIIELNKIKTKPNWYVKLSNLKHCDVKGTNNLTPVPGCIQGGFIPYFVS
jgi:hypothetical protein